MNPLHMVPGVILLISIGYNYNVRKVLSFIVKYNAGSTQAGIYYLSKYPNQFSNVAIFPVDCPLIMYKFFGSHKNQVTLIWCWISSRLISVVVYGYVQHFLLGLLLIISGNHLLWG